MAAEREAMPTTSMVEALGFEGYEFDGEGLATIRMPVHEGVKQPFGIVHGGAYAALAETVSSRATHEAVAPRLAIGQANESIFMRPVRAGTVHARARAIHRGSSSWVWDVEMHDDDDRLCATSRLIIAIRDPR